MSVQTAFRQYLLNDSAVSSALGSRLRPVESAPGDATPYAVYTIRNSNRQPRTHGGLVQYTAEIMIVGTYDTVTTVGEYIRRALDEWRGNSDSVNIRGAFLDDEEDVYNPPVANEEVGSYSKLQTWSIWAKETRSPVAPA